MLLRAPEDNNNVDVLGSSQTSNFTCVESNVNEVEQ